MDSLKENDRVLLLNKNSEFDDVKLHTSEGLKGFPEEL